MLLSVSYCELYNNITLFDKPRIPRLPRPIMRHTHIEMAQNFGNKFIHFRQRDLNLWISIDFLEGESVFLSQQ